MQLDPRGVPVLVVLVLAPRRNIVVVHLISPNGAVDNLQHPLPSNAELIPDLLQGFPLCAHLNNGASPGLSLVGNTLSRRLDLGYKLLKFFIHAAHFRLIFFARQGINKSTNDLDKIERIPYHSPIG